MKSKLHFIGIIMLAICSFSANAQNWDEILKSTASDRDASDNYGKAVAIDGDYAIVGAWGEDEDISGANTMIESGAVYILYNNGDTWIEVQKIVASDRAAGDNFGYAVDISGDYAVVGAWKEAHDEFGGSPMVDAGSAYIFQNISGTWTEIQKIVALDREMGDYFGHSVAIDANNIVVGAYSEDEDATGLNTMNNSGSAYVFTLSGTWIQTEKLVANDRFNADYFGFDVDISANFIICGAWAEDEDEFGGSSLNSSGSAYVFEYTTGWTQVKKITANTRGINDYFGYSVAIDGFNAVVGAYEDDEDAFEGAPLSNSGAAYIFLCLPGGLVLSGAKLVASDREDDDRFGYDVAINGNNIIIGAYLEDDDEIGNNELLQSGSAYIFDVASSNQTQKIVSIDRQGADYFGCAVDVSNDYILVGAQLEDHDADGNNNRPEAGSAYVFHNRREINVYQSTDIVDGGTFDFGNIVWGSSSSELTFTIENTGVDNLILNGTPLVEISGVDASDFTLNQVSTSTTITPSGSTTFTITYNPSNAATHTAEISISNNDTDENPYNFTITGTGLPQSQTITGFAAIPAKTYGDSDFLVLAIASSGLDVVFTSSDLSVATCGGTNGELITIVGAGTCDIHANQTGNTQYNAAPQVSQTLVINQKNIGITAVAGQTKEYGDIDPIYTFTITIGSLETADSFSGALTRNAGETIGLYTINIGTLDAGPNYNMSFVSNDFEITERTIYVTAAPGQNKEIGQSDPGLTYSYTPALIGGDSFNGTLNRVAGEDIGFYEILQGSLSLNSNYILDYTNDSFEITPKHISVTPNPGLSKVYGTTDPILTYTYSPALGGGDSFSGTLSRDSGEDTGLYAISQGTLTAGSNYILTIENENMEITAKPITVVANSNQNKSYGNSDPSYTYYLLGTLETGDSFTGELSRETGEDVGTYALNIGTLSAGANYNVSFTSADFEIIVKSLMITPDAGQTKGYGEADPVLTFVTTSPIAPWDTWSGSLSRDPGENIGNYDINQGDLALNSNYSIFFSPMTVEFEITKQAITVTADPGQSKYYGEANPPEYTYTYTGTLASGDSFTGALNRDFGESVGTFNINQGSLWISTNYLITYVGDFFEILPGEIVISADAAQSKEYGDSDPTYTYTYTGTLASGDNFSGELSRVAGEDIGGYEIQQGSLALNSNYNLTYSSEEFQILPKDITVTADASQTKEYGNSDPIYTYSTSSALVSGDSFSGELSRVSGENVGMYEIQQGTLDLSTNYNLTYVSDDFEITTKEITLTVDSDQAKTYGEADPTEYTYTYTPGLVGGDIFTGELTREAGEDAGDYAIEQGSLSLDANYTITFQNDFFTINPIVILVTPDAGQSKTYGEPDPAEYTYTYTGTLQSEDEFSGTLSRDSGEDAGLYTITAGSLTINSNYILGVNVEIFEIIKANPVITWNNPADIYDGTELTATQLNAVADVAGSFTYNPDFGTVLPVGDNQELTCEFTPDDNINYNTANANALINVLLDSKVESFFTNLKVYPNPTRDNLYIDFGELTDANIKVLDISGKIILEKTVNNSVETLNMSIMPAGVYFVEIQKVLQDPQQASRIRVVVQ